LNGSSIFYNAYPLLDGNPAIPMMQGIWVISRRYVQIKIMSVWYTHLTENRKQHSLNNYEFVVKDAEMKSSCWDIIRERSKSSYQ